MKRFAPLLLLLGCAAEIPDSRHAATPASDGVRPGLEVFLSNPPAAIRGKQVGLITNHSGIDRQGRTTIDLLHALPDVELVALFSPEHGIRGTAADGEKVESGTDGKTGLPIFSLYGETRQPTAAMLEKVDALVYDIQDVGVRQYTYESTMVLAMRAAAEKGIPIVVLDRPNPITGTIVEGNILEPEFESFVGIHPVASRHGMTMGELARMYNEEQQIGADLTVVPMEGWRREMWWEDANLPRVNPSPNLRRTEAEIHYPGTVFFEAINVSEGRGTDTPFEQVGAPWLENQQVVDSMNALELPGVRFEPVTFAIAEGAGKYPGETVQGVRLEVTDRNSYRPIRTSLLMIDLIRRLHPDDFQWRGASNPQARILTIERHGGTARLREAIEAGTLPALLEEWDADAERFRETRSRYLLYQP